MKICTFLRCYKIKSLKQNVIYAIKSKQITTNIRKKIQYNKVKTRNQNEEEVLMVYKRQTGRQRCFIFSLNNIVEI